MVLTSRGWHDLHADEYDASYEGKKWVEIYDRVTWDKTIKPYLPHDKEARILDAGGGTGKWTIPIVKMGYCVSLSDVSKRMLEIAKQKLVRENLLDRVEIVKADVTKMDMFKDATFDFVLCEGDPLSYCTDPLKGIGELVRVAKRGSFIVASVDNLYSRVMGHIRQGQLDQATKALESQWVAHEFPVYFFKPGELAQRFQEAGCKVENMIGKNIFSRGLGEDQLSETKTFQKVLKLELEYCEDPYFLGMAGHIAVICKKL